MQEASRKPEDFITGHLRHFAFWRVFVSSQGKSKTSVTSETKLFVKLVNDWKQLTHVTWRSMQDITEVLGTPLS